MMGNSINQSDLSLILQSGVMDISVKLEILNEEGTVYAIVRSNIISGTFDIDSTSDIRRTCSLTLQPDRSKSMIIDEDGYIWINKSAKIYIGIKNTNTNQYVWYSQGCYYFKDSSSSYDAVSNTLTVSCCDPVIKLDGTKNGLVGGASQIIIPAYETDTDTDDVKYNKIRDSIISILEQLGKIDKYIIDEIGEQNAMKQVNSEWENYREKHPQWNSLPYDQEFTAGCSVFSMLTQLRDIYPNYEMFFDTEGYFICRMIPNCDNDNIVFDNNFLQKILISEDSSLDLASVKNVCEVWGETLQTDRYAEQSAYIDNKYICSIDSYEKYSAKEKIAVKIGSSNADHPMLQINELDEVPIYNEVTDTYITANTLEKDNTYVFRIDSIILGEHKMFVAYLLGEWQPHAVTALVNPDSSAELYTTSNGLPVSKYSKEYFKDIYNCNCVSLIPASNSPFTVQKIGEILDVKSGGDYNNITSDSLALERAEYENWKNCRLTDSITIKTTIVPFADVNIKCSYQKNGNRGVVQTYIVKSISHDFSAGTTTWTMYRHYPSLKTIQEHKGTHNVLKEYSHMSLGMYTHEKLTNFFEGGL